MSYERSIASYKAGTPLSAIWCFLFEFAVSSIFLKVIQLRCTSSSSSFCHFCPSLLSFPSETCFRKQFLSRSLCNTSSFFTRSIQLLFAVLLSHNTSNTPRYFWSTFWSVQVKSCAPNAALYYAWFQASATKKMRTVLFSVITQRVVVIS